MGHARIRIANRLDELPRVAARVDKFGRQHALPPPVVSDLNVVLDEVLNNVISYGYADAQPHWIAVRLHYDGAMVTVVVSDDGVPFDPLQAPPPPLAGGLHQRSVGGLGIHFMRTLMDDCRYSRQNGRNVLAMIRRVQ